MIIEEENQNQNFKSPRKSQSGKFRSHKSLRVKSRPQPKTPSAACVVVHSLH